MSQKLEALQQSNECTAMTCASWVGRVTGCGAHWDTLLPHDMFSMLCFVYFCLVAFYFGGEVARVEGRGGGDESIKR